MPAQQPYQHFIVEIEYQVPAEQLGETVSLHRAFLQAGYDQGWLLYSGPQVPKTGGIVIARAPSLDAIQQFFAADPYCLAGVAKHRFIQFEPVKSQPFMAIWID